MPRHLLLMRHAKSDWNGPGQSDKDRPLNARGQKSAPMMATWLFEHGLVPNLVLCSSAVRTCQTLQLMVEQWERLRNDNRTLFPSTSIIEDKLYLATDEDILSLARDNATNHQMEKSDRLMVLGHNPGMEILASTLSATSIAMPTGAIAVLASNAADEEWPENWADVKMWKWRGLVKPRELGRETI